MEKSRQLPLGFGNSEAIPVGEIVYVQMMHRMRWRKTLRITMVCSVFFCCVKKGRKERHLKTGMNKQRGKERQYVFCST